ncbi:MAG: hypothetical protein ABIF11_05285 [Nitrospirota bacterium]
MKTIQIQDEVVPILQSTVQFKQWGLEYRLDMYKKRLKDFEANYNLSSKEFVEKFNQGILGDDKVWFEWLNTIDLKMACEKPLVLLQGIHL